MRNPITQLSRTPRLLVAIDFDGTLAPIVPRPEQAVADGEAIGTLLAIAGLPQTDVAVVSGRALRDLRERVKPPAHVWLVGGHGAEIEGPRYERHPPDLEPVLDGLMTQLRGAAPESSGFLLERKRASVAVHYRAVDEARAERAVKTIAQEIAPGVEARVRHGKMVIELLVWDADKGSAVTKLRALTAASGVIYAGDDVTDEDAFRVLGQTDLAVKVGEPPTEADVCVPGLADIRELLATVLSERRRYLAEIAQPPVQDHAVLSDQRTLAVVRPDGRIVWLCLPRVDGPTVFASLLDADKAGYWTVEPAEQSEPPRQRYVGNAFTLETAWATVRVTDYLDGTGGRAFQRAGRSDLVRVVEGSGVARTVFVPRPDFGRAKVKMTSTDAGLIVEGGADPLVLVSPGMRWTMEEVDGVPRAVGEMDLSAGPVVLELRAGTRSLTPSRIGEPARRQQTDRIWTAWAASLTLPSVQPDKVLRSALVLRALVHGPTGSILAAATSSLPETAGGTRNWDYRFCWPRDAAVAAAALVELGNTGVAMRYLDWLLGVVDRCAGPERLRPIYSVTSDELGPEAELSHLSGYRASGPVRIGNSAAQQVQLDVFGPIVDLVYRLAEAGAPISPDHWRLVEAMALAVERSWHEPDHGIWEVRTEKRHHVHSKAMCWLALDRAVKLADQFVGVRRESWEVLRDRVRDDVLERGFDRALNAFVAAYDLHEPDAATLCLGLCGLIDPADARFIGTVDLVARHLLIDGTVLRYTYNDDIPGQEGGFHLCTGWLIQAMLRIGRTRDAEALFQHFARGIGPTGLMSEQWCPVEQTGLGNLAQAYSHAAFISAACALSRGSA